MTLLHPGPGPHEELLAEDGSGKRTSFDIAGDHQAHMPTTMMLSNSIPDFPQEFIPMGRLGKPLTIGSDVWIDHGAKVIGRISVGDGAIIAAESVVINDVPPYAVVAGTRQKSYGCGSLPQS